MEAFPCFQFCGEFWPRDNQICVITFDFAKEVDDCPAYGQDYM
jgi:hypothetical protein